jgi:hypothetical protein
MAYQGESEELHSGSEYLVVEDSTLTVSAAGKADVNYGDGNIISLYGPEDGQAELEMVEWNGTRQVVINAGAGEVYENPDDPGCKATVLAETEDGDVEIISDETYYLVVVNPEQKYDQVQVAVEEGEVTIIDTAGNTETLEPEEAGVVAVVSISDGKLGDVEMVSTSIQNMLKNYQIGIDITEINFDPSRILDCNVTLELWHFWTGDRLAGLDNVVQTFSDA